MTALDISDDELQIFLQEAEEQLTLLDESLVRLEHEPDAGPLLQGIFRAAHTLKGSSSMLGLRDMAELTHHMEDVLDRVRKGTIAVSPALIDALLLSLDALKVLKEAMGAPDHGVDIESIVRALRASCEGEVDAAAPARPSLDALIASDTSLMEELQASPAPLRINVSVDPASSWGSVRLFQVLQALSDVGHVIASSPSIQEIEAEGGGHDLEACVTGTTEEVAQESLATIEDLAAVTVTAWERRERAARERRAPEAEGSRVEQPQTVRIDVDRLDAMINLVGELIIDRTRVNQMTRTLNARYHGDETVAALDEIAAHVGKVIEDLNERMLQVRMVPVGVVFSKLPRLVRDIARSTGKQVNFLTEGEETEIDRTIVDKIKDPLMHLLRNAVDHGIELPEQRLASGKSEGGTVLLSARHEQGRIVISLRDDGAGMSAQALRDAAVEKGLLAADAAARLTDKEALDIVFQAGFSTAAKTTDISGRGVGLDVVRTAIHSLNGSVAIDTEPGAGTTFTITLPLTLATFRGLLVESARSVYVIPLSLVQETGRLNDGLLGRVIDREVVNLRGTVMPLIRLRELHGAATRPSRTEVEKQEEYFVIVKVGQRPAALAVDALVEQQEIVVKSLGPRAGQPHGVAGASILGDGQVALILDVPSILKAA